jgi:hypothetical protein
VHGVQDRYQLPWQAPPVVPTNQGYVGTCVAHSMLKVIVDQLCRRYGVKVDFDRHVNKVIEAADCLDGVTPPDAAKRISDMKTGFEDSHGHWFRVSVDVYTYDSFDELLCAVRNSNRHYHIVTGTSTHAVVPTSLHGPDKVKCIDSHARKGPGSHAHLTREKFHDFDIVFTTITAKYDGDSHSWVTAAAAIPPVRESWTRQFGSTHDELAERLLKD